MAGKTEGFHLRRKEPNKIVIRWEQERRVTYEELYGEKSKKVMK